MFSAERIFDLLVMGWLSTVPLVIGSITTVAIFVERYLKMRGLEAQSRDLSTEVIEALARRDLAGARQTCESSDTPFASLLLEGLRWQNVAIEDLERVFATIRAEMSTSLRSGIWLIGTTGSLAPFVGLFGTVVGIIRAFGDMAEAGSAGFAVVALGISEALIATALGLGVAIVALFLFNFLQVRVQAVTNTYARGCERLVQALLYVESSATAEQGS
jgi:biopolymer transport protein ExbB/TolQ